MEEGGQPWAPKDPLGDAGGEAKLILVWPVVVVCVARCGRFCGFLYGVCGGTVGHFFFFVVGSKHKPYFSTIRLILAHIS